MKFSIRDLLWLMIVVGLAISWWVDNRRIESSVTKLDKERQELRAEYVDKMTVIDEAQKQRSRRVKEAISNREPLPRN